MFDQVSIKQNDQNLNDTVIQNQQQSALNSLNNKENQKNYSESNKNNVNKFSNETQSHSQQKLTKHSNNKQQQLTLLDGKLNTINIENKIDKNPNQNLYIKKRCHSEVNDKKFNLISPLDDILFQEQKQSNKQFGNQKIPKVNQRYNNSCNKNSKYTQRQIKQMTLQNYETQHNNESQNDAQDFSHQSLPTSPLCMFQQSINFKQKPNHHENNQFQSKISVKAQNKVMTEIKQISQQKWLKQQQMARSMSLNQGEFLKNKVNQNYTSFDFNNQNIQQNQKVISLVSPLQQNQQQQNNYLVSKYSQDNQQEQMIQRMEGDHNSISVYFLNLHNELTFQIQDKEKLLKQNLNDKWTNLTHQEEEYKSIFENLKLNQSQFEILIQNQQSNIQFEQQKVQLTQKEQGQKFYNDGFYKQQNENYTNPLDTLKFIQLENIKYFENKKNEDPYSFYKQYINQVQQCSTENQINKSQFKDEKSNYDLINGDVDAKENASNFEIESNWLSEQPSAAIKQKNKTNLQKQQSIKNKQNSNFNQIHEFEELNKENNSMSQNQNCLESNHKDIEQSEKLKQQENEINKRFQQIQQRQQEFEKKSQILKNNQSVFISQSNIFQTDTQMNQSQDGNFIQKKEKNFVFFNKDNKSIEDIELQQCRTLNLDTEIDMHKIIFIESNENCQNFISLKDKNQIVMVTIANNDNDNLIQIKTIVKHCTEIQMIQYCSKSKILCFKKELITHFDG
ncbi:hypothetical protein PPERSA_00806 [Pseudocohnilembus persalinus]|uniref:Uncharacterized protein n=1 Tax=Pseudocohnilembus persalinus TaxID=266149 RepID=A0A0V0QFS4_PSEPJ|nr:hypothetical protein PPERSA_00806 [Pseudocohnilembus persalinus]|eukprot:KRX01058.1 hypothetical protein PPERSA_00806 [Pseudocohnilembus persalinus]